MSNPKGRTIPDTLSMYLVILVLYCLDIFFLKTDQSVLGDAVVSRVTGLGVIAAYIWATKDSLSLVGLSSKKEKMKTGLALGAFFSLIPIAAVMFGEAVIYGITDISALNLRFQTPNQNFIYNIENLTTGTAVIIYFCSTLIGCAMKELVFRGFILKKLKKVLTFNTANILQALLYMFMTIPWLLRNLLTGLYDKTTTSLGLFIICFYIIHETIAGIKWGLLTRVTGSTYAAIVEHFLFVFISNSLFITDRYVTWSFMAHNLAIQVLSFVFVLFYYRVSMKKLNEKAEQEADDKEKPEKKAAEKVEEKIQEINEISPSQYKSIVDETHSDERTHHHRHHHSHHDDSFGSDYAETDNVFADADGSPDETDIDDFLKNFSEDMSKQSHHRHRHHHSYDENGTGVDDDSENFDADAFLKKYSESSASGSSHHSHSSGHSHHHHHSEISFTETKAENSGRESPAESQKDAEEKETKRKQSFIEKMLELGKPDGSDLNDLL